MALSTTNLLYGVVGLLLFSVPDVVLGQLYRPRRPYTYPGVTPSQYDYPGAAPGQYGAPSTLPPSYGYPRTTPGYPRNRNQLPGNYIYPDQIPGRRRRQSYDDIDGTPGVMTVHVSRGEQSSGQGSQFEFVDAGCVNRDGQAIRPRQVDDCGVFVYTDSRGLESVSPTTGTSSLCNTVPLTRTRDVERISCSSTYTASTSRSVLQLNPFRDVFQLANPGSPTSMFGVTSEIRSGGPVDLYTERPSGGYWVAVLFKPVNPDELRRGGLYGAGQGAFSIASADLPAEGAKKLTEAAKEGEKYEVKDVKKEEGKDEPKKAESKEEKKKKKEGDQKEGEKKSEEKVKIGEPAIA